MQYDFETLTDRRGAGAAKWDMMYAKKKNVGEGIVPLSVADMEFSIAPEIRAALAAYVQEQIPGYAAAPEGFAESVCAFLRRRHGIEAAPEELIQTPGVVYALPRAIRALTEAGDGVILFTPVYYPFYRAVRHAGREIRSCPLRYENGRYSIDFDLFERLAAEERTTALLLCSPHNPVGRVWTAEEIRPGPSQRRDPFRPGFPRPPAHVFRRPDRPPRGAHDPLHGPQQDFQPGRHESEQSGGAGRGVAEKADRHSAPRRDAHAVALRPCGLPGGL